MKKFFTFIAVLTLCAELWAINNVPYIDANGQVQYRDSVTGVINSTDTLKTGWYVVMPTGNEKQTGTLVCQGEVHLIVYDGAKLTATGADGKPGIEVSGEGNSLTIYGYINQSGQLIAIGGANAAGIGGGVGGNGSNITIYGGEVTATGGNYAAGIGGGNNGIGSNITINGGTITATGGLYAAGIGGGVYGSGSDITINGGEVTATGGNNAAGIGGGIASNGSNITINGGAVTATGGYQASGIGGGEYGSGSNIIVSTNLTVKADGNNPPTTVIPNTGSDLASSLNGKQYVTTAPAPSYRTPVYNTTDDPTSGILRWDTLQCTDYTLVTDTTTTLNAGWYVVTGSDVQTGALTCNGAVNLILADGAQLTASGTSDVAGITVSGTGNSLTIYAQSTEPTQMGELTANGGNYAAGIGGGYGGSGSNIIINGGAVTATGGISGAGIGGGEYGSGSNITINGGAVTATGGDSGAGIGGGERRSGSNITINGGEVTATGGISGAGIGGGVSSNGSNITINGGEVAATGGLWAAGIGGGYEGSGSDITINGGAVIATGGDQASGIGGGAKGNGSNITINGGAVAANGGSYGAGIGGGYWGSGSNIIVSTNLIVKADGNNPPTTVITNTGSDLASSLNGKQYVTTAPAPSYRTPVYNTTDDPTSGILRWDTLQCTDYTLVTDTTTTLNAGWYVVTGSDVQTGALTCNGAVNLILADGAQLTASGTMNVAGITVSGTGNSLTIYAQSTEPTQMGELTATSGSYAAGIGGGAFGNGSNITINGGAVAATGGYLASGIGGGVSSNGSNITINGGTVTANGGYYAAGIGGGNESNGSDITINGGEVIATGGENAAGIGGGSDGSGSDITINGGEVTATGGNNAAGIGGGVDGNGSNIIVSTNLVVKADGTNPPTTVITNTGSDLASSLNGKQYVTTAPATATITATVNDTAMGRVTGAGTYDIGSQVTLTATANEGYTFTKWTNASGETLSTDNPWTMTVTQDTAIVANFAPLRVEVQEEVDVPAITYDYALGYTGASSTFDFSMVYDAIGCYANDAIVYGYNPITEEYILGAMSTYDGFFSANGIPTAWNESTTPFCIKFFNDGTFWYCTHPDVAEYGAHYTCSWILVNPTTGDAVQYNFSMNDIVRTATITANVNDTAMGRVTGAGTYNYGTQVTAIAVPADHYHFVNWSNGETNDTIVIDLAGDTSLTANFAIDTHTVTLAANDDTFGTVEGAGTYDYGTQVTAIAVPAAHYHFVNWSNGETNDTIVIDLAGDTSIVANFAIDTHTVALAANDATFGTVEGAGTYNYGTQVTAIAVPAAHYHFVNWSNGETNDTIVIDLAGDTNLVANFAIDTHSVATFVNNATMGEVTAGGTYDYGTQITLTATHAAHYHFVNWSNGSTANPLTVTVEKDTSITANFAPDTFTVTLAVNDAAMGTLDLGATLPEGVVDNGDGTYGVPYLTTVVAQATPASRCFDFTEWSDSTEVNADGTDTLTIVEDYSLTATFVRHDFPGDTTASECDQFTWHDSTYTVTPETAPTFLYTTADECDSTVTLHLTIRYQNTGIDEQDHCDTYTWINNETYTESDSTVVYTLEGANAEGCDSVVTLHLTIRYSTEGSFTAQANVSYEWLDETFTADGVYTRVITNAAGCDSTVTMTLSIMPVNTPIPDIYSLMDVVLMINHNPGDLEDVEYVWYRWYRNGVLVKEGADADSYDEGGQILDGCYYLEVCTDLTQNYWVRSNELCFGTTGIDDAERVSFRVAPNPASRGQRVVVAVENAGDLQGARLTVYDAQGRKAIEQSLTGSFEANLSAGVYMLRLTTADGRTATQRLVVR